MLPALFRVAALHHVRDLPTDHTQRKAAYRGRVSTTSLRL